jgi:hypothetical protein
MSSCESDWASVAESRIIVTEFIVYFLDMPIYGQSKAKEAFTLSSNEAEYVMVSEIA